MGEIKDHSGTVKTKIQADKVYSRGLSTEYWGPEIRESVLVGDPTDLTVTVFLSGDHSSSRHRTVGTFWLTPSIMLSPVKTISRSYSGKVAVKRVRQSKFKLANGPPLR
jgi:hypothetical protein